MTIYCGKGGGQVSICDWSIGVARMFCACGTDLGILLDVLCCIFSSLLSKWPPSFFVLEDNVCFEPHHNQRCKIMKIYEVYAATTLDIHKEKNCVVYVDVSNG